MTAATVPVSALFVEMTRDHIVNDPKTARTALYCVTAMFCALVAGFTYVVTMGGDVAALSFSIASVISAGIGGAVSLIKARKNGGSGDGGNN